MDNVPRHMVIVSRLFAAGLVVALFVLAVLIAFELGYINGMDDALEAAGQLAR